MVHGRWFVTGTDTDAGKTVCTAALAAALSPHVVAAKPVATGVRPGTAPDDAVRIARAAGHEPLCYRAFAPPLSPHRAADAPYVDGLLAWTGALDGAAVLVEGVGGWRVPLGEGRWVVDLARVALGTGPGGVIVVAPDRIGVLNHLVLTVGAIRGDGLAVTGVVLNRAAPVDPSRRTNARDAADLLDLPVALLPSIRTDAALAPAGRRVWAALGVRAP
jgi:dethiobiotin synthetase